MLSTSLQAIVGFLTKSADELRPLMGLEEN